MTPPNEQKYPSEELILSWWNGPQIRGCTAVETVARKAADWQRARDAEICEAIKTEFSQELPDESYRVACTHCATAIREGTSRE